MSVTIHTGDVLAGLAKIESGTVQTCVTSPPYWGLRDYGTATWEGGDAACDHKRNTIPKDDAAPGRRNSTLGGSKEFTTAAADGALVYRGNCGKCGAIRVDSQIGLEPSPDAYVARMVEVFREVRRCLRDDGTLWLNLGDSYAANRGYQVPDSKHIDVGNAMASSVPTGLKPKDLCMIPWRVALALQSDGWWLRSVIVWAKKSPMPESVTDRPTSSWEPIFLLAKSSSYYYDAEAVKEQSATGSWDAMPPIGGVKHPGQNGNATYSGDTPANNGTRNQRNVWHLGPEPYAEAHFATFPTEIPRRCILAGTSEKGCCAKCGAGWVRVVEKPTMMKVDPSSLDRFGTGDAGVHRKVGQAYQNWRDANPDKTIGWEPSCQCNAGDPVPCLVLEPFLGSGTTLAVAAQLGRNGVGCELNPEYVKLAQDRIGRATRPNTYQSEKAVDAPLFGVTL